MICAGSLESRLASVELQSENSRRQSRAPSPAGVGSQGERTPGQLDLELAVELEVAGLAARLAMAEGKAEAAVVESGPLAVSACSFMYTMASLMAAFLAGAVGRG